MLFSLSHMVASVEPIIKMDPTYTHSLGQIKCGILILSIDLRCEQNYLTPLRRKAFGGMRDQALSDVAVQGDLQPLLKGFQLVVAAQISVVQAVAHEYVYALPRHPPAPSIIRKCFH